jgi:hypothetical protein
MDKTVWIRIRVGKNVWIRMFEYGCEWCVGVSACMLGYDYVGLMYLFGI